MALCKLWVNDVAKDARIAENVVEFSLERFDVPSLKPAQSDAVASIISGRDVFVSVPTGYGKSLIYQLLPFCAARILYGLHLCSPASPCVLVLSPLKSLMYEQSQKMRSIYGANPVLLAREESSMMQTSSENFDATHIFSSPEALFDTAEGRKLLLNENFVQTLVAVAIDEVHCIVKW